MPIQKPKIQTFITENHSVVATCVVDNNGDVFVHYNYPYSMNEVEDNIVETKEYKDMFLLICNWCGRNSYNLKSY